jgi:hypothetical protein
MESGASQNHGTMTECRHTLQCGFRFVVGVARVRDGSIAFNDLGDGNVAVDITCEVSGPPPETTCNRPQSL